jgi:hypothetical protein
VKFSVGLGGAVCALLLSAGAAKAAPTLKVSVAPPEPGTSDAPRDHTVTIDVDGMGKPGATGAPQTGVMTLRQLLPATFADQFRRFESCPAQTVRDGHDRCPKASYLGSGEFTSYVPALALVAKSKEVLIYKTGDRTIRAWVHITNPSEIEAVADARLDQAEGTFGPTVTWDFSPAATGAYGTEARVMRFQSTWAINPSAGDAGNSKAPERPHRAARKTRPLSCTQKARRIKHRSRRRAALRRCARRRPAKTPSGRAGQSTGAAPFASTGCTGGTWKFRAEIAYKDGTAEAAEASVSCGAPQAEQSPPPGGTNPANPLCPPICRVERHERAAGREGR